MQDAKSSIGKTANNNSDLNFEFENTNNGYIAYYAELIVDKNGNRRYRSNESELEYIDTTDGFLFKKQNDRYTLIAYLGTEDTVTLPNDINGERYVIYRMRGIRNVIIPDNVTSIGSEAFSYCSSLTSITIPDSVTSIGNSAFYGCSSLTSITIPDSVTSIGGRTFYGCTSLTSITIPDSVTSIGYNVFDGTAYYNNPDNWENDALYIGKYLIKLSEDAAYYVSRGGAITDGAFSGCYKLKKLTIGGNHYEILSSLTNLETLVLTELPTHYIYQYFGGTSSLPITLKNIVLADGVHMRSDAFSGITGVTIYVAANEKDVRWDENFPGWNNGNKVVYGDKWITADFYDKDGNIISSDILLTSQIVRQPYVASMMDDTYYYEFLGWDIDGDGIDDVVPATSSSNISARAVYGKDYKCVAVGHSYIDVITPPTLDSEGFTTHTCSVCGDEYIDSYVDKLQYIIGDVNGDRAVNKDDAIHLLMHIFYPDVYPVNQNCDFDGNGIVDTDDAIYLLMHISFPDAYPIP